MTRRRCQFVILTAVVGAFAGARLLAASDSSRPPSPALPIRAGDAASSTQPRGDLLVLLGAEGTPEYGAMFGEWASLWETAAQRGSLRFHLLGDFVGDPAAVTVKDDLRNQLQDLSRETELPLWIVMIGHGTFDGRVAKFNLVGTDLSAEELAEWLVPCRRPVAVVQCASASAPFIDALSAPGRVIITSTKSAQEINFARFGGFMAAALTDSMADLDKDALVSLLEAFLRAARLTGDYYTGDNRLATEHPLLDDNGDARGSRASAFAGVRPVREADSMLTLDGYIAHQWRLMPNPEEHPLPPHLQQRRDELEIAVLRLRERKGELSADEYYAELETLLVELARISLDRSEPERVQSQSPAAERE